MRVLLLEDDDYLAQAFARALRQDGYAVDHVRTLREVRVAPEDVDYDCMVLDRHVPDGDLLEAWAATVGLEPQAPVVLVSADADADARVEGLGLGADDFVPKPVRLGELVLRVRNVIRRRSAERAAGIVRLGKVWVDLGRREVTCGGRPVQLSPIQYSVFEELVRHRDRVLTTQELLDHCWDRNRDLFSNPLPTQITRLRKAFGGALTITKVRGVGYRLEVDGGGRHRSR